MCWYVWLCLFQLCSNLQHSVIWISLPPTNFCLNVKPRVRLFITNYFHICTHPQNRAVVLTVYVFYYLSDIMFSVEIIEKYKSPTKNCLFSKTMYCLLHSVPSLSLILGLSSPVKIALTDNEH